MNGAHQPMETAVEAGPRLAHMASNGQFSRDGRIARGERTRLLIAEAVIELIEEGDSAPTAKRVAERAGVSLRLVFHHFADVEALIEAAALYQFERHWGVLRPIDPTRSIGERVALVVRQRRKLFEAVSPVRRAGYARFTSSPAMFAALTDGRTRLREQLAVAFAPEIEQSDEDPAVLLDAIDTVAGWEAWDALRYRSARTVTATERTVRFSLNALLAAASVSVA